jgi:hypothetical protein
LALQKDITTPSGIEVKGAYARIDSRSGKNKGTMTFTLNYYVDRQAFIDGKSEIIQEVYSFVPSVEENALNDIKQGYEYLKTLPEFEGAVDILE